jgi:hypothetical protein
MMGRKTKGGFEMTSKPLRLAATGVGLALAAVVGVADGEGEVSGLGDGDPCGVGEAVAASVKLAQGNGLTLAHRRWTPGASPGKGFTWVTKLPLPSALAPPATWPGESQ